MIIMLMCLCFLVGAIYGQKNHEKLAAKIESILLHRNSSATADKNPTDRPAEKPIPATESVPALPTGDKLNPPAGDSDVKPAENTVQAVKIESKKDAGEGDVVGKNGAGNISATKHNNIAPPLIDSEKIDGMTIPTGTEQIPIMDEKPEFEELNFESPTESAVPGANANAPASAEDEKAINDFMPPNSDAVVPAPAVGEKATNFDSSGGSVIAPASAENGNGAVANPEINSQKDAAVFPGNENGATIVAPEFNPGENVGNTTGQKIHGIESGDVNGGNLLKNKNEGEEEEDEDEEEEDEETGKTGNVETGVNVTPEIKKVDTISTH
jgi:hypothetical protein